VNIAYQIVGDGPVDLVFVPGFISNLASAWWRSHARDGGRSADRPHTGECELVDGKLEGIAVDIGARVAAQAEPGEVLVSDTLRDLVAGSEIRFLERGSATLAGIPGQRQLFAVDPHAVPKRP
jgi:hypothetical protein